MPKEVKNFVLLVDHYRRPSRQRNTTGRYRVGAKSADEAIKILKKKIGFGSITVYYEINPKLHYYDGPHIPYKAVVKQIASTDKKGLYFKYVPVCHANAPRKKS